MIDDDIKSLREAIANPALHDPDAPTTDTWEAVLTLFKTCNKDRVARLLDEIDRLKVPVAISDLKVVHSNVRLEAENRRLRALLQRARVRLPDGEFKDEIDAAYRGRSSRNDQSQVHQTAPRERLRVAIRPAARDWLVAGGRHCCGRSVPANSALLERALFQRCRASHG